MATILDFRPRGQTATDETSGVPRALSAELIFFPGVRYERAEPEAGPKRSRKRRTRPHDSIDLPD